MVEKIQLNGMNNPSKENNRSNTMERIISQRRIEGIFMKNPKKNNNHQLKGWW